MVSFKSSIIAAAVLVASVRETVPNVIDPSNPLIWYHGRWDSGRGTWWTGTGFTLYVENLSSLSVHLGPNTTQPFVSVGISLNYGHFNQFNLTTGANKVTLPANTAPTSSAKHKSKSVVRLTVQGWENNNLYLNKITLNAGASLLPYKPSKLNFQLVGDSFSAGQYVDQGINQAWPFLVAEEFKAEQQLNAIPGICMANAICWGNQHGLSNQFFKTEDTLYYFNPKHNYTTDWDFRRDYRPSHVFLEAGANDNYFNITGANLTTAYLDFIGKVRYIYPIQPIFVVGSSSPPEGIEVGKTPDPTVSWGYYASGVYETVLARHALGDKNVYFIDTKGWIHFADVISNTNFHFSPDGHARFAQKIVGWLGNWGLQPENKWATSVE